MFAFNTKENNLLMKKFQLDSWLLLFFLVLQFTSCDNEPLEGEFPQEEVEEAGEGQFVATIDGVGWVAETAAAIFNEDNFLVITGQKTSTGETIAITVENAGIGIFDISAGLGNQNSGVYIDAETLINPYISAAVIGGSGQLEITEINADSLTISGTFSFVGARIALDAEGNPIEDGDGNPVIENVTITNGAFNNIPYETGGGGGGGVDPLDDFFAKVDEINFTPQELTTTRNLVGDNPMIKIIAINAEGQKIRIDIPETLGVGTFMMEQISDGTKLIGQYNPNGTSEDLSSNPGTITITEFNTLAGHIVATFEFIATDPLNIDPTVAEITDGSFDVRYEPGATSATNSMIVDINGAAWVSNFADAFEYQFFGTTNVTVRGYNSETGESIEITFPKDLAPGSYDFVSVLVNPGESIARFYPVLSGTEFTSTDGSIIVISNELETGGTIEAAFLFLGEDLSGDDPTTYMLTNGQFIVELP